MALRPLGLSCLTNSIYLLRNLKADSTSDFAQLNSTSSPKKNHIEYPQEYHWHLPNAFLTSLNLLSFSATCFLYAILCTSANNIGVLLRECFRKNYILYMRISNNLKQIDFKKLMKESILNEIYRKANETTCFRFLETFKEYLNKEISEGELDTFKKENHFDIEILPTYGTGIRGFYSLSTKNYVIQIEKGLEIIFHSLTNEQLYNLVKKFWLWFIHEDTHKQQDDLSGGFRLGKNYIRFLDSDPMNLDIQQNVDYFNQLIEADAYAREVGEILKILYDIPREGIEPFQSGLITDIMNDIKNGKIKDEDVQQITNIYWDPRINKKAKMKFFGTLYEYLYGEES